MTLKTLQKKYFWRNFLRRIVAVITRQLKKRKPKIWIRVGETKKIYNEMNRTIYDGKDAFAVEPIIY